ncbi:Hypothetical protein A7982_11064 [Minicystis rosea]|nr:Hypothetical protein A7982_11064 [Minicystis rosea]
MRAASMAFALLNHVAGDLAPRALLADEHDAPGGAAPRPRARSCAGKDGNRR